jgi:hypothetical protein
VTSLPDLRYSEKKDECDENTDPEDPSQPQHLNSSHLSYRIDIATKPVARHLMLRGAARQDDPPLAANKRPPLSERHHHDPQDYN